MYEPLFTWLGTFGSEVDRGPMRRGEILGTRFNGIQCMRLYIYIQ